LAEPRKVAIKTTAKVMIIFAAGTYELIKVDRNIMLSLKAKSDRELYSWVQISDLL
jgi:hypothetical protein